MSHLHTPLPLVASRRKELGLTRKDLGFLLGHQTASYIARIERGEIRPGLQLAVAIAQVLGTPLRRLWSGEFGSIAMKISHRAAILARRYAQHDRDSRQARAKAETLVRLSDPKGIPRR